jgi:uncharacterized protein
VWAAAFQLRCADVVVAPPLRPSTPPRGRHRLLGLLLVMATLALAWGFVLEPQRLVVNEQELRLPRWPAKLSGLKVALLADLHVGSPFWDLEALSQLVERTNKEKPDLILLAGDYQINDVPGGRWVSAEDIAQRLAPLRARHGVFAVLGNHDWYNDGEATRRSFVAHGITVLEDQVQRITIGDTNLYLAGLADQITRKSSPARVMAQVPKGAASLLLVHEPDVFGAFPALGIAPDLTLAGHTHGGQVWLPVLGRRIVPSEFGERYAYGHVVEQGRDLFVTSGVGTSILPVRFLVPPEIAILTLR